MSPWLSVPRRNLTCLHSSFYDLDNIHSGTKTTASIPCRWGDLLGTRFLNEEHDVDTIMQTTNEGVVRIQRNALQAENMRTTLLFRSPRQPDYQVVTAWCGQRNELSMSTKLGSIVQWNLLDARRVRKHRTTRMLSITCLDYEKERGYLLAAGYADGALELFDQRQSQKSSVAVWDASFKSKALSCHLTTGQEVVSIQ